MRLQVLISRRINDGMVDPYFNWPQFTTLLNYEKIVKYVVFLNSTFLAKGLEAELAPLHVQITWGLGMKGFELQG